MSETKIYNVNADGGFIYEIHQLDEAPAFPTRFYRFTDEEAERIQSYIAESNAVRVLVNSKSDQLDCSHEGGHVETTATGNEQFRTCTRCRRPYDIKSVIKI